MWEYSDNVRDHYLHPRNVGEIENPDGYGEIGNVKCGDALRLTFTVDSDNRIDDIKFKTFGCGSAIASSSILTEMCKGLTIEEASKITNDDVATLLEGNQEVKMHCSAMGQEALEEAIAYYKNGGKTIEEKLICTCFNVTEKTIVEAIKEHHLTTVSQITNYTKAGSGCGSCIQDIEEILARVQAEITIATPDSNLFFEKLPKELTTLEKIDLIREVLDRDVRPGLQRDGGDCELVNVEGNLVTIRFIGACSTCSYSEVTSNDLIKKTLLEKVSEDLEITVE